MSTKKLTSFFNIDTTGLDVPSARATLIGGVAGLLIISLLMVASASIPFASSHSMNELHFFQRQLTYIIIGIIGAITVSLIPIRLWMHNLLIQFSGLMITAILLLATLIFADKINGSKRWLELGAFNFQTAELAKFVTILFTGSFLVRRSDEVRQNLNAFIRISLILSVCTVLLLLQPDFGSLVIIVGCILAMFFVAGAPLAQFIILFTILGVVGSVTVFFSPYRM
ncbi:MAG: FtsW/RodA/SpoVE family cell cycle protein, partial [Moraxellaceae bacterium]|nr:FtsW/RodA/SpoVE family cell cycle protein [Moraxellaceae bacterium]